MWERPSAAISRLPMPSFTRLATIRTVVVLFSVLVGRGVRAEPPTRISLRDAIEAGARRAPSVVEAEVNERASVAFAGRPGTALPSLPQLSVLGGVRSPYGLPTGPEIMLTVQQEIAARDLGGARRGAASAGVSTAGWDLRRARLASAEAAGLAWIALREADELTALRQAALETAQRLSTIAESRGRAGAATGVERALAEAEVGSARLGILEAEGRRVEASIALAHALRASLDSGFTTLGALADEAAVPSRPSTQAPPLTHPLVGLADARAAQLGADTRLTRAVLGPTFSIGASAWREGSGDKAIAALVSVPLPFFDPARYDGGRQALVETAAREHARRLRAELVRDTAIARHDRDHTREVESELREHVVMPLQRAHATALVAYEAGATELATVLLARRTQLSSEERLVGAKADVVRAAVRAGAVEGTLLAFEEPAR